MRAVRLSDELLRAMQDHARATYPDECCGFLVARESTEADPGPREVVGVEPAPNEFEGERRRRFLLRPDELRSAEARAAERHEVVVGFYHSHPDHPARPSLFDQEHAWPWYTYLVLGVTARGAGAPGAFELDPHSREFREVPLTQGGERVTPRPCRRGKRKGVNDHPLKRVA